MTELNSVSLDLRYVGFFENDPQWGSCLRYKIEKFEYNQRFNGIGFSLNPNSIDFDSGDISKMNIEYRIEEGYFVQNEMDEFQKPLFEEIVKLAVKILMDEILRHLDEVPDA